METKKSDRANLEKKRSLFFQTGLLFALGIVLVAFEWQVAPRVSDIQWEPVPDPTDGISIVIQPTFPEPPPPPPAPPQPQYDLDIVDNHVDIPGVVDFDWDRTENVLTTRVFVQPTLPDAGIDSSIIDGPVDFPPSFSGFREFAKENLRYPQIAIDNDITGTVFIQFVVDRKGAISDMKIVRGVDQSLDDETLRLIKSTSGMWAPGVQGGKTVNVRFTFPVTFRLQ